MKRKWLNHYRLHRQVNNQSGCFSLDKLTWAWHEFIKWHIFISIVKDIYQTEISEKITLRAAKVRISGEMYTGRVYLTA